MEYWLTRESNHTCIICLCSCLVRERHNTCIIFLCSCLFVIREKHDTCILCLCSCLIDRGRQILHVLDFSVIVFLICRKPRFSGCGWPASYNARYEPLGLWAWILPRRPGACSVFKTAHLKNLILRINWVVYNLFLLSLSDMITCMFLGPEPRCFGEAKGSNKKQQTTDKSIIGKL